MKEHNTQETSLEAFKEVKPHLPKCRKLVYDTLKEFGPMTNMELTDKLEWSINRLTPRIHELRKQHLVVFKYERTCEITGRKAMVWGVL